MIRQRILFPGIAVFILSQGACIPPLPDDCGPVCSLLALTSQPTTAPETEPTITPTGTFTFLRGDQVVAETGTQDFFQIVLDQEPTADVVIPISSGDPGEFSVSATSLTFTPANWDEFQPVIVTGVDDAIIDTDQVVNVIVGPAVSADPNFNGQDPADVSVTVQDDESPNIIIDEPGFSTYTVEGGTTDSYTIQMTTAPTATVTLTITPDAQASANGSVLPVNLTFTTGVCPGPATWCNIRTVTVAAIDDAVAEGPNAYPFTHTTASADGDYSGIPLPDVFVVVDDNDKFTFRTAAVHSGDFDNDPLLDGDGDGDGIAEADEFCNTDVNRPNFSYYSALLSVPVGPGPGRIASATPNLGDGQVDWILQPNFTYYRQDGTTPLFSTDASGLFVFGAMSNSFEASAGEYWTALRNDWVVRAGLNCSGWASTAGNGSTGDPAATNGDAIQSTTPTPTCATAQHVICVEQ